MWWKIYFWIDVLFAALSVLSVFEHTKQNVPVQIFLLITYCFALLGLSTYIFKKHFFTQQIWKYYFWFYLFLDCFYLAISFLPAAYLHYLSFLLVTSTSSLQENVIDTLIDIPLLYALYQLSKGKVYEPTKKKNKKDSRFKWGMLQMALWGYSSILTLFFLILAFFPQGVSDTHNSSVNPFFTMMFTPLFIFWLWVLVRFKDYHWNWLRTTLLANALFYSGAIIWGLLFPQPSTVASGFDIISILQLSILLVGYYVFGKEQFA